MTEIVKIMLITKHFYIFRIFNLVDNKNSNVNWFYILIKHLTTNTAYEMSVILIYILSLHSSYNDLN